MGAPTATGSPPPPNVPSRAPRKSKGALIGVVAVVIVVLIILALFLTGVIPGLKSSSSGGGGKTTYHVTFTETGLPSSTSWSVTLAGSTQSSHTSTIVFTKSNGTYTYGVTASGYTATPASGSISVSGANLSQSLAFSAPITYNVTFTETGLPSGTSWSATLAGSTLSSTTSSIVFQEASGTYAFTVQASGYTASPGSGSVTVAGADQSQAITFTAVPSGSYDVTFTESGLPSGTNWSVTLNGTSQSSTTSSIVFTIGNGSWSFSVGAITGYTASPPSGTVAVSGAPVTRTITFTSSGGGGGGGQTKFSQAYPIASSSVGSGWIGILGVGISVTSTWSNASQPSYNSSCPLNGGPSTWPTLSAWTGAYANGYTTYWVFGFYKNVSSVPTLQIVLVSGSTVTNMGSISGSGCILSEWGNATGLASGVIDSDQVASAIAGNDSAYVAAHPSASADYSLVTGLSYSFYGFNYTFSPLWSVHFTTCSVNGGGTGSNFTADVNATNGQVIDSSTQTGACGNSSFVPHSGGPAALATFASGPVLDQLLGRP